MEVGCGTGRQLKVVHERQPGLALFGLDLSEAAIRNAERNLEGLDVDLRAGSIEDADYEDDFFDFVTCFSSMSYWENLVPCFDEIHRILKPGGAAQLVEPQKDVDIDEVCNGGAWIMAFLRSVETPKGDRARVPVRASSQLPYKQQCRIPSPGLKPYL